jgi:hypothetical protein
MKNNNITSLVLLASIILLFSQCKKTSLELVGSSSKAGFSFVQMPASDTLPYPYAVEFTNTSEEAFLYQWNFGDNAALSPEKNPVHVYKTGGTFNVTLTTVGTYGNNSITKFVSVTDACQNDFFNKLTNCSYGEWTWSSDADAVKFLLADGTTILSSDAAVDCQSDDIFKFSSNGTFNYEANDQTYNQATSACGSPKANATTFKVVVASGNPPSIILGSIETGNPFIGTTNAVEGNKYEVRSFTENTLRLRGKLSNGNFVEIKLKKKAILTLADIKNILTGGSSRSWKLDPTDGANAITVGTEGNPTEYFGGGPLEPNCQVDDVYTFSSSDNINYNANGSTFNGGNIAPNYNCGSDRSYSNTYTFSAIAGGAAGLAMIQLPLAPPANFIGTTDVPTENMYRIIEITPNKMLLRAGNGSGVVFQFKFVRQ